MKWWCDNGMEPYQLGACVLIGLDSVYIIWHIAAMHVSGDFKVWRIALRSYGGGGGSTASSPDISMPCQLRLSLLSFCVGLMVSSIHSVVGDSMANRSAVALISLALLTHAGSVWIRVTAKTLYRQLGQTSPAWIGRTLAMSYGGLSVIQAVIYVIGLGGGVIDVMRTLYICWVLSCMAGALVMVGANGFAWTLRSHLIKFTNQQKQTQPQPQPPPHPPTVIAVGSSKAPVALPPVSESEKEDIYRSSAPITRPVPSAPPPPAVGTGSGGGALTVDTTYIHAALRRLLLPLVLIDLVISIGIVYTLWIAIAGLIDPPDYDEADRTERGQYISVFNAVYFAVPIAALYATWPNCPTTTSGGSGVRSNRVAPQPLIAVGGAGSVGRQA